MNRFLQFLMGLAILGVPAVSMGQAKRDDGFKERYKLREAVVLSRHNIRSPLSGSGSKLDSLTTHDWHKWSSAPSELTSRGGALETIMGQYFRKWGVDNGLFEENAVPTADELSVLANSMQRTIATAQYFTSGFMPVANLRVQHRFAPSKMDPIFNPQITKVSEKYKKQVAAELADMAEGKGLDGINSQLNDNYEIISEVLDFDDSEAVRSGRQRKLGSVPTVVYIERYKEPYMRGSLNDANSASDAFILQYYEEPDTLKAAFGHDIDRNGWKKIAKIKDVYGDVLFTAPSVAVNVAHPLLQVIYDEYMSPVRKFSFLCGHDSNIASVLAALGVEEYELPQAIEQKTPIGSKLVIEKWVDDAGEEYANINLVYQSVDQLRDISLLDLDNPPMIVPLHIKGLTANADGLYKSKDLQRCLINAIRAYDAIEDDPDM